MPAFAEEIKETVEVPYKKNQIVNLEIHPDGPQMDNPLLIAHKVQQWQRVGDKITGIERQLYEDKKVDAIEAVEIDTALEAAAADKDTRQLRAEITVEEFEKLNEEIVRWGSVANMRQLCVDYLKACIIGWDLYASKKDFDEGKAPLPITREVLNDPKRWSFNDLLSAFNKINAHYNLTDSEGNESGASLPGGSQTPKLNPESAKEVAPISTLNISSPEPTAASAPAT